MELDKRALVQQFNGLLLAKTRPFIHFSIAAKAPSSSFVRVTNSSESFSLRYPGRLSSVLAPARMRRIARRC